HGLSPQRMTDKCFRKCIGKPGGALDNSEQKCIAMCMDRYMDSWNTVSRAYNSRLQRERANM
ncbi:PREDICTED: mitochondrial import inner membrane translocase subunit Tim13, partial [Eurypyga helias]